MGRGGKVANRPAYRISASAQRSAAPDRRVGHRPTDPNLTPGAPEGEHRSPARDPGCQRKGRRARTAHRHAPPLPGRRCLQHVGRDVDLAEERSTWWMTPGSPQRWRRPSSSRSGAVVAAVPSPAVRTLATDHLQGSPEVRDSAERPAPGRGRAGLAARPRDACATLDTASGATRLGTLGCNIGPG